MEGVRGKLVRDFRRLCITCYRVWTPSWNNWEPWEGIQGRESNMVRFMIYADHSGCLLEYRLQPERLEGGEGGRGGLEERERGSVERLKPARMKHIPSLPTLQTRMKASLALPLGSQAPPTWPDSPPEAT